MIEAERDQYGNIQPRTRPSRILRKGAAFSIDFLICLLMLVPLWIWFIRGLSGPESGNFLLGWSLLLPLIWVVFRGAYLAVGWTLFGTTIAGLLFKHQVLDNRFELISLPRAMLRYASYLLNWLTCGLACLTMLTDKKNRGLHDLISGTIVIDQGL